MKRNLIILGVCACVVLTYYYVTHPLSAKVKIDGVTFTVDVAATEAQKEKGLGGRTSLPTDHGMLFPYDHKEQYEYWMRGMHFPLDFIWIDGKTVADVTANVPPPVGAEAPMIVKPNVPVDKVLEVNAGTILNYSIKIGDTVMFLDR